MTQANASIEVRTPSTTYRVEIGPGLLERPQTWSPFARNGRLAIVADEQAWHHHRAKIERALAAGGIAPLLILRRGGEELKNWANLEALLDDLLHLKLERGEPIVALGGGTIGDLAGFAAAILKRGCPVVQVPTTLLAQVDSAVGGKTGINTASGKNLVGAFHQPAAVIIDPDVLATLPARHVRNGMAEIVKYGLMADAGFFEWCETSAPAMLEGDRAALSKATSTCVQIKASIVADDERDEDGRRALLNFGHSFAHALEAEAGYSARLLHGEAVSVGMVLALELSAERGHIDPQAVERAERLLRFIGLPTRLRDAAPDITSARMVERMAQDKKVQGGALPLILLKRLGKAFVTTEVSAEALVDFLDRRLQDHRS